MYTKEEFSNYQQKRLLLWKILETRDSLSDIVSSFKSMLTDKELFKKTKLYGIFQN